MKHHFWKRKISKFFVVDEVDDDSGKTMGKLMMKLLCDPKWWWWRWFPEKQKTMDRNNYLFSKRKKSEVTNQIYEQKMCQKDNPSKYHLYLLKQVSKPKTKENERNSMAKPEWFLEQTKKSKKQTRGDFRKVYHYHQIIIIIKCPGGL